MLNEMEVTGQAFEDMQEQNLRLLQQLREKDDANFKLMSEVSDMIDWLLPLYNVVQNTFSLANPFQSTTEVAEGRKRPDR